MRAAGSVIFLLFKRPAGASFLSAAERGIMSDKHPSPVPKASEPGEHPTGADSDPATCAIHAGYEFNGDTVHSDDLPAACSSHARVADEHSASDDDDSCKSIQHHFTKAKRVVEAKQCDPSALFRLSSFGEPVRTALDLFLRRHEKRKWMQAQKLYVQKAALAAAHEAMHPVFENVDDDGCIERFRNVETEFDAGLPEVRNSRKTPQRVSAFLDMQTSGALPTMQSQLPGQTGEVRVLASV